MSPDPAVNRLSFDPLKPSRFATVIQRQPKRIATMSQHQYTAEIAWQRGNQVFVDNRYSRSHVVRFDGGVEMPASASPHVVRPPLSDPAAVDPEELFVAALSSCHMLWFLSLAAKQSFCVDSYLDQAAGVMAKGPSGKLFVSEVTLRPAVAFSGQKLPSPDEHAHLHHLAHLECFIANSIRSEVHCFPTMTTSEG
jgi:organic hydroperoxide reductase OsmC/OhrA